MSERISLKNMQEHPIWFLMNALGRIPKEQFDSIPRGRGYLEVELKIDGVEVPFEVTLRDCFERIDATLNERAARFALEQVELKGLGELHDLAKQFRWQYRQKLEQVFGITFPED